MFLWENSHDKVSLLIYINISREVKQKLIKNTANRIYNNK